MVGKNSFAVFGLGAFGRHLALELHELGNHVTVVDIDKDRVKELQDKVDNAIIADASSEDVIREMDVKKFTAVILGMSSNFEAQLLALNSLRVEGAKKVYAKAGSDIQQKILSRIGADEIRQPEKNDAKRLAEQLTLDNIFDLVEFKGSAIAEVSVPREMIGRTLRQLDLRNQHNINVLMIQKPGGDPKSVENPDTELEEGDKLMVFGSKPDIVKKFRLKL